MDFELAVYMASDRGAFLIRSRAARSSSRDTEAAVPRCTCLVTASNVLAIAIAYCARLSTEFHSETMLNHKYTLHRGTLKVVEKRIKKSLQNIIGGRAGTRVDLFQCGHENNLLQHIVSNGRLLERLETDVLSIERVA
jgi:hypothetical protein